MDEAINAAVKKKVGEVINAELTKVDITGKVKTALKAKSFTTRVKSIIAEELGEHIVSEACTIIGDNSSLIQKAIMTTVKEFAYSEEFKNIVIGIMKKNYLGGANDYQTVQEWIDNDYDFSKKITTVLGKAFEKIVQGHEFVPKKPARKKRK